MRLQLPTVICVCVSLIIMITLIVFMNANEEGVNREAVNVESEEFKTAREFAAVAFNAKRYTQAIEHYKVALRMRPENAYVHNDLGATYYEFGLAHAGPNWPSWDTDLSGRTVAEALRELQTAIAQTGSGYIVFTSDNPEVTKEIQEKARAEGARIHSDTFQNNAKIHILIGKTKEFFMKAESAYLQAKDIKPSYPKPYMNLGALYMKIGKRNAAVDLLENAYRLDSRDKELEEYLNQLR